MLWSRDATAAPSPSSLFYSSFFCDDWMTSITCEACRQCTWEIICYTFMLSVVIVTNSICACLREPEHHSVKGEVRADTSCSWCSVCTLLHVDLFVLSGTVWNWDIVVMMMALPLLKCLLMFKLYMIIGHRPEGGRLFCDEPITFTAVLLDICHMSLPWLLEFVYLADECRRGWPGTAILMGWRQCWCMLDEPCAVIWLIWILCAIRGCVVKDPFWRLLRWFLSDIVMLVILFIAFQHLRLLRITWGTGGPFLLFSFLLPTCGSKGALE